MAERTYTLTESDLKGSDALDVYVIKRGDTLHELSKTYKTTVETLVRINGIKNAAKIEAGDKLLIPIKR